ncbi:hypothetical protein ACFFTN_21115 [Aminobacter aganoensis]|uniref:Secreted protein n=1 Tax=Aminobacter aganoensis TaxID=83264 RepID=A0A7X0FCP6_9HYPH|nr:hypothetical protein [Aminobacter aganoensis]MBB6356929.1 hypothetical protein [Aminobacter aganoensis]
MLRLGFMLGAIVALAFPAHAAERCRWYIHETNPDSWIQDNGADLSVHFPGDGAMNFQFIVYEVDGLPNVKRQRSPIRTGQGSPQHSTSDLPR